MYHTASMPFILVILILFYIMQMIYHINKNERIITFGSILLTLIMTLTYWMYAGIKVFNSVFGSLFEKASDVVLTKSIVITPLSELFNYLQYSPLLLFIIIGVLWGLTSKLENYSSKAFLLLSLLLVPITLPGPALLINKLAGNFNLARFGEYTFIFICIAGATGTYILFSCLKKKYKISVIILFFIMAFLTVSNDFTASDNPLVKRPFYTYYFSEQEVISINRAAKIANGYLMSDYICCRYLENSEFADKIHVLEVGQEQQEILKSNNNDIILLREKELLKRPVKLFTSPNDKFVFEPSLSDTLDYYYNDSTVWKTLDRYNQIYDSGSIKLYQ